MKSMQIDECNDGTFTCSTRDHKGDEYSPGTKHEKTTHPNVEDLKKHIDKHFKESKTPKKKEPKLSELNDRFNKLTSHKK